MALCTMCLAFEVENLNFHGGPIRDIWIFFRFSAFSQFFNTKSLKTLRTVTPLGALQIYSRVDSIKASLS